ncbi:response regulator [Paenibacillus sp. SYP-B4298]|uniref:response regulator n=1 Tax=Paenibacillus sp. SYP-B4298 TaxID=2996034 RepID=UPI0022DDA628|nr:response regulator [Paenibacillus sp. SYP-B4298]
MKRILIADDADVVRLSLRTLLHAAGYEVVAEARTGREAVELYEAYKPDLVTMDLTMPDMDGVEATRKIIEMDVRARVVVCSAYGEQKQVLEAIAAGAKHAVSKPLRNDRLIQAIAVVLNKA